MSDGRRETQNLSPMPTCRLLRMQQGCHVSTCSVELMCRLSRKSLAVHPRLLSWGWSPSCLFVRRRTLFSISNAAVHSRKKGVRLSMQYQLLSSKLQFSASAMADVIGLIGRTNRDRERERERKKLHKFFFLPDFLRFSVFRISLSKVKQRKRKGISLDWCNNYSEESELY